MGLVSFDTKTPLVNIDLSKVIEVVRSTPKWVKGVLTTIIVCTFFYFMFGRMSSWKTNNDKIYQISETIEKSDNKIQSIENILSNYNLVLLYFYTSTKVGELNANLNSTKIEYILDYLKSKQTNADYKVLVTRLEDLQNFGKNYKSIYYQYSELTDEEILNILKNIEMDLEVRRERYDEMMQKNRETHSHLTEPNSLWFNKERGEGNG